MRIHACPHCHRVKCAMGVEVCEPSRRANLDEDMKRLAGALFDAAIDDEQRRSEAERATSGEPGTAAVVRDEDTDAAVERPAWMTETRSKA